MYNSNQNDDYSIQFWILLTLLVVFTMIFIVTIIMVSKRTNIQPLKKRSPLLIMVSIVGNFLVILNISNCTLFFEQFKTAQERCFLGDNSGQSIGWKQYCISNWTNNEVSQIWIGIVELSGRMLLPISEMLAILPYLLRSLRIQKMFKAREIYCEQGQIPKRMIWNWKEPRIIQILVPTVLIFGGFYVGIGYFSYHKIVTFNTLSAPINNNGLFPASEFSEQTELDAAVISTVAFLEYLLLCWAMHAQWYIDKEYNIFIELFWITVNWFFCNSIANFIWITDRSMFKIILNNSQLPLNELRWVDYACLTFRSLGCILITSIHSIWTTYS